MLVRFVSTDYSSLILYVRVEDGGEVTRLWALLGRWRLSRLRAVPASARAARCSERHPGAPRPGSPPTAHPPAPRAPQRRALPESWGPESRGRVRRGTEHVPAPSRMGGHAAPKPTEVGGGAPGGGRAGGRTPGSQPLASAALLPARSVPGDPAWRGEYLRRIGRFQLQEVPVFNLDGKR